MKQRAQIKHDSDRCRTRPFRCPCGSMLARLVPNGVELKCRKCKRQIVVPLPDDNGPVKVKLCENS
ncbi:MAG: hypothetical protein ACREQP_09745 [Candidatus Binatia bacterium]